ncbi:unnamed protein product [Boreogadus saida]
MRWLLGFGFGSGHTLRPTANRTSEWRRDAAEWCGPKPPPLRVGYLSRKRGLCRGPSRHSVMAALDSPARPHGAARGSLCEWNIVRPGLQTLLRKSLCHSHFTGMSGGSFDPRAGLYLTNISVEVNEDVFRSGELKFLPV